MDALTQPALGAQILGGAAPDFRPGLEQESADGYDNNGNKDAEARLREFGGCGL